MSSNGYTNHAGDTGNVQCEICGWWVPKYRHTWLDCARLIHVSGKLRLFDEPRQEVPQAFYDAFKNEERDNE